MNKYYNKDGKVAVLVSYGYGAGWSTWNSEEEAKFVLFDKALVEMALRKAKQEEVDEYIEEVFGNEYVCTLGWDGIAVEYLEPETNFLIREYDGNESLDTNILRGFTA